MKNELAVHSDSPPDSYEDISLKDSTGMVVVLGRGIFKHLASFSEELEDNKAKQITA